MNSFTDGSAFCPGAPKRVPSDSEQHRRVYTSSNICHSHEWRVDTASGKTLKKRNACSDVRRSAVQNKIAGSNGLRSEGVNAKLFFIKKLCIFTGILFYHQEWESNASRAVSVRQHLEKITDLVIQWRKLELGYLNH